MAEYFDKEKIWPKHRFNFIGGAPGAGKTTWILPQLIAMQRSGCEILYTCCDRVIEDAYDTLEGMGEPIDAIPMASFQEEDLDIPFSIEGAEGIAKAHMLTNLKPKGKKLDILFIECIPMLVKKINDVNEVVGTFGRKMNHYMRRTGISVWGSSWSNKMKQGESWTNTRDAIAGTAGWTGIANTTALVTRPNGDEALETQVKIMLRHGPPSTKNYLFEGGKLIPHTPLTFDSLLLGGGTLYSTDIEAICKEMKVNIRTGQRWLKQAMEEGKLDFMRRGEYLIK